VYIGFIKKINDKNVFMCRKRDSRGRFISIGRSSIPTSPLIPPRPHSATPPTKNHIPSFASRLKLPKVHRYEIQSKDSPTYSTKVVVDEPTSPTEGVIFLSSTREPILGQEWEVSSEEEEEEETYFIPLI